MRSYLIFDLGETLINFNKAGLWHQSLCEDVIPKMIKQVHLDHEKNAEEIRKIFYNHITLKIERETRYSMIDRLRNAFYELGTQLSDSLMTKCLNIFYNDLLKNASIYPEVNETLSKLISLDYQLGLWSDTPWDSPGYLIDELMQHYDFAKFFSVRLYSGDYLVRKPDPKALELVRREAKCEKGDMIYIGNHRVDIEVAANFGVPSVWVNRTETIIGPDFPQPDYEITNLRQIIGLLPIE